MRLTGCDHYQQSVKTNFSLRLSNHEKTYVYCINGGTKFLLVVRLFSLLTVEVVALKILMKGDTTIPNAT